MGTSTSWSLQRNVKRTTSEHAISPKDSPLTRISLQSHFSHPTIRPSNIYVDAVSMALLKGSTIDFATELIGSSFRVLENPQVCSDTNISSALN